MPLRQAAPKQRSPLEMVLKVMGRQGQPPVLTERVGCAGSCSPQRGVHLSMRDWCTPSGTMGRG